MNVLVALLALPQIKGNPRYLLFLMAPLPVFLALALDGPGRRWLMALLVAFGAAGSLAQASGAARSDPKKRSAAPVRRIRASLGLRALAPL